MRPATDEAGDGRLLEAWRRGDTRALQTLVERHQAALLRHARSLLGEGGPWEDAVQEAFLKLVQAPPDVANDVQADGEPAPARLAAWLHRVTRNACMDVLRNESRRRRREETTALEAADRFEQAADRDGEARDTRDAVQRGLDRLPSDQREVLVLRLIGEQSYREIAAITGKQVGTVGWLISLGLKALAAELGPMLEGRAGRASEAGTHGEARLGFAQGDLA